MTTYFSIALVYMFTTRPLCHDSCTLADTSTRCTACIVTNNI